MAPLLAPCAVADATAVLQKSTQRRSMSVSANENAAQTQVHMLADHSVFADVFRVPAFPSETIASFRAKLGFWQGLPTDIVLIVFAGRLLEDSRTLSHYGIHVGSTLPTLLRIGTRHRPVRASLRVWLCPQQQDGGPPLPGRTWDGLGQRAKATCPTPAPSPAQSRVEPPAT